MPLGLGNASATVERLMEQVLPGMDLFIALIYLDDTLIHADSFSKHLHHLHLVLERLRQANLKLSPLTASSSEVLGPHCEPARSSCG